MHSSSNRTIETDLLVIGGGILGASYAYHSLSHGLQAVLLERNAAPRGATVRNFGQVVPSGLDSHWQYHGRSSLEIYHQIQSSVDLSVRQHGSIYLASDEDELTLIEELAAINQQNDYESELLTAEQCRRRYPNLAADYCLGGLSFPREISVNPRMMIHRLHQSLSEQPNFQSHFRTCVRELQRDGETVVATTNDNITVKAKKAIVCCGAEFQLLFPELFRSADIEAVKIQMLRLQPSPSVLMPGNILTGLSIRRYEAFSECPSWGEIKQREPEDSFWKQWGIHILFKQEQDGGIILGDSHEYADGKDELDFDLRQSVNDYLVCEGQRIFQLPSWNVESAWYGVYSQSKDASGIFNKTVDERIHIVTGIGGKGMTSSLGYAKQHLEEILNV